MNELLSFDGYTLRFMITRPYTRHQSRVGGCRYQLRKSHTVWIDLITDLITDWIDLITDWIDLINYQIVLIIDWIDLITEKMTSN